MANLAVLGVDVYVPRTVLPSARRSGIVTVARPAPARESARSVRAALHQRPENSRTTAANPVPRPPSVQAAQSTRTPQRQSVAASSSQPVAFNLVTLVYPRGVFFVSDIRRAPLSPEVEAGITQFLDDVMRALDWRQSAERAVPQRASLEYFEWPLSRQSSAGASADRAAEVLAGLIARQLRDAGPRYLVLMGESARYFVQARDGSLAGVPVINAPALGKLFGKPELKAGLWRQLQALVTTPNDGLATG